MPSQKGNFRTGLKADRWSLHGMKPTEDSRSWNQVILEVLLAEMHASAHNLSDEVCQIL